MRVEATVCPECTLLVYQEWAEGKGSTTQTCPRCPGVELMVTDDRPYPASTVVECLEQILSLTLGDLDDGLGLVLEGTEEDDPPIVSPRGEIVQVALIALDLLGAEYHDHEGVAKMRAELDDAKRESGYSR